MQNPPTLEDDTAGKREYENEITTLLSGPAPNPGFRPFAGLVDVRSSDDGASMLLGFRRNIVVNVNFGAPGAFNGKESSSLVRRFDTGKISVRLELCPVIRNAAPAIEEVEATEENVRHALIDVMYAELQKPRASGRSVYEAVRCACYPTTLTDRALAAGLVASGTGLLLSA